jgi:hypothetical protein
VQQESTAALKRRLNALRNEARAARTHRKKLLEECAALYAELTRRAAHEFDRSASDPPGPAKTREVAQSRELERRN